MRNVTLRSLLFVASFGAVVPAQSPSFGVAREPAADQFAQAPGEVFLTLPGIADDFQLYADGQFVERPNGTARLTAFLRRVSAHDRELFLEAELSGLVLPGAPNHPPAAPRLELLPGAYSPAGPADPSQWRYYTAATITLTGFRSYDSAVLSGALLGAVQVGRGANNRNVVRGLFAEFAVQVVTQGTLLPLQPAGPATLHVDVLPELTVCAAHVDRDPTYGSGVDRVCVRVPGVADDYVFIPAGRIVETADGRCVLSGVLRRELDFADRWLLQLVLSGRLDPGAPNHPPANRPTLQLASIAYVGGGGAIDPQDWRYYEAAAGTLTGEGTNAGGVISLAASGAFQIGLGAAQGNTFFGVSGACTATVTQQPAARALVLTGEVTVHAHATVACILPYPNQTPGLVLTLPNVGDQPAAITGTNLAWIEQLAIGTHLVASDDPGNWYRGYLRVVDTTRVEVHPPQGLPPGTYTTRVFTRSGTGGLRTMVLQHPPSPVVRTERERGAGAVQHWVVHRGAIDGPVLSVLALSADLAPSVVPGVVGLDIGSQFATLLVFPDARSHDPVTGAAVTTLQIPASALGLRMHCQAACVALARQSIYPLEVTDVRTTDYR